MKYVNTFNLFEATKSKILGKTLRNVKSRARQDILDIIKAICLEAGKMPLSEIGDKYFRYERKSLRMVQMGSNNHTKCQACGGDGYTQVVATTKKAVTFSSKRCSECKGEGVKYIADKNLYKFWLSEDGYLEKTTFTDGAYHGDMSKPEFWKTERVVLPAERDAFDSVQGQEKFLSENGIIPGKTRLILRYGRSWNPEIEIGVFWKDNNGEYHFINNAIGSNKTRGEGISIPGTKWKDLGTHHISLDRINNDERSYKVELYKIVSNEPTEEPYGYNQRVDAGYRGSISKKYEISESDIKDADFVITFDFDAYKADADAGQFKPTEETGKERQEARKGAIALHDNESIRKANLERYRQKIADLNLKEGLGRLINKTPHLLGGTNFLLFSMKETFRWDFDRLINYVYDYLDSVESGEDVDYHERQVVERVKGMISNNQKKNSEYVEYMTTTKKQMEDNDPRMAVEFNKLHKEFERISRDFKNAYFSKKFETIEQLSTITGTIKMLDHLEDNRKVVPNYIWKISDYFGGSNNIITTVIEEEFKKNGDLSDSMKKMTRLEQTLKFQFGY